MVEMLIMVSSAVAVAYCRSARQYKMDGRNTQLGSL